MIARVASLHIYPIKSCGGINLNELTIGPRGPVGDREWMIVDKNTKEFLTQRQIPAMALVKTQLYSNSLQIILPTLTLDVSLKEKAQSSGETGLNVKVWKDFCLANEPDSSVSEKLSQFLKHSVQLVRMQSQFTRLLPEVYAKLGINEKTHTGFADQFPLLLTSTESLFDLNKRLNSQGHADVEMNRFRTNVVITLVNQDAPAFTEHRWKKIRIGSIDFNVVKDCERCMIINTNQHTAERGAEPLKTLASYRQSAKGKAIFGVNMIPTSEGFIKTGDTITILEKHL